MPTGRPSRERQPIWVVLAVWFLGVHVLCLPLVVGFLGPSIFHPEVERTAQSEVATIATVLRILIAIGAFWSWAGFPMLALALSCRQRTAWSAAQAALFVRTAAVTAATAWLLMRILHYRVRLSDMALVVAPSAALTALTIGLFSTHGWFGIERRQRWRTMLREGGWALAVTAVGDMGLVGLLVLSSF